MCYHFDKFDMKFEIRVLMLKIQKYIIETLKKIPLFVMLS